MKTLKVWTIDGEDIIVATTERNMRRIYMDYHEMSIRGRDVARLFPADKMDITDGDDVWTIVVKEFSKVPGYFAAYR